MTVTSVWSTFTGFLSHHANDLNTIAGALSTITGALPIDSQDKEIIANGITQLEAAAGAITEFLAGAPASVGDITVKESDIETAVRNVLSSWGYKDQTTPPAETNQNNGGAS